MQIIITMAGRGTRFRNAGYDTPKYMIESKGKTLFEWSMKSLVNYNKHVSKYIFIVRKEDESSEFIKEKCYILGIKNIDIIELEYETDGQATTCMEAIHLCNKNESILIYNIDTYVEENILKYSEIKGDGFIPCFRAEGDHWSFVGINNEGKVTKIAEKERISSNCTLGAYYFSSAKLYEGIYNEYYMNNKNLVNNEKYIAPMYNLLINKGYEVEMSIIDYDKVHVLGTPEELEVFNRG